MRSTKIVEQALQKIVKPINSSQFGKILFLGENSWQGVLRITTTRSLMVVPPSVKQGWEKIHPTGAAPERLSLWVKKARKCVKCDYRYESTLKQEHFQCWTSLDFFVKPDNHKIYGLWNPYQLYSWNPSMTPVYLNPNEKGWNSR